MKKTSCTPALFFLTFFFLIVMACQALLLFSRFEYQKGITFYKTGAYDRSLECLSLAKRILPDRDLPVFTARDRFRIHTAMGKTYYKLARQAKNSQKFYGYLKKGATVLDLATAHDALSYRTSYWAAKIHAGLEAAWPGLGNTRGENPYNALAFYEKTIALRPTGITVYYDFMTYLYHKGDLQRIPELAAHAATIFPASVNWIMKEPFYTEEVRKKLKQGLLKALKNNTTPRTTLFILSQMFLEENDIEAAILYHSQGLQHQAYLNTSDMLIRMGMLFLKLKDFNDANDAFIESLLLGNDFEPTLERIYGVYKKETLFKEFVEFTGVVEQQLYPSKYLDLAIAACRMDSGQHALARAGLNQLNGKEPEAKAYDLLAKIAQTQEDWDAMELAAQKAVKQDPENHSYRIRFSMALAAQKKNIPAEKAAGKAIALSNREIFWYYGVRAGIRFEQKKYRGAVEDWKKALKIKPNHANYYYALSKSYNALNQHEQALIAINRATLLNPEHRGFLSFKEKLLQYR